MSEATFSSSSTRGSMMSRALCLSPGRFLLHTSKYPKLFKKKAKDIELRLTEIIELWIEYINLLINIIGCGHLKVN